MKVILVDDDANANTALKFLLESEGYYVQVAVKGQEALPLCKSFQPDVLIADWKLCDDMDGIELAKKMQRALPNLKVVFMSGLPKEDLISLAAGVRAAEFLEKPIELDRLLKILQGVKL